MKGGLGFLCLDSCLSVSGRPATSRAKRRASTMGAETRTNPSMAPWVWVDEEKPKADMPPPSLYKYYSPSGIQKAIETNCLKWALPCDENDPFEAAGSGWDIDAITNAIAHDEKNGHPLFDVADADAIFDLEESKKRISHAAAFISFAERGDNVLMWSHYGKNHTGACLEFDTRILAKSIDGFTPVTYAGKSGEVRERIPLPHDDKGDANPEYMDRVRGVLSHKANEWAYEEEWRMIVPPMVNCIESMPVEGGFILVTKIPVGAIKKLIFGYNTPISIRLAWTKQIRKHHPACALAEITLDKRKFQLSIDPLEIDPIPEEGRQ